MNNNTIAKDKDGHFLATLMSDEELKKALNSGEFPKVVK